MEGEYLRRGAKCLWHFFGILSHQTLFEFMAHILRNDQLVEGIHQEFNGTRVDAIHFLQIK
jgi:hypothetical protein